MDLFFFFSACGESFVFLKCDSRFLVICLAHKIPPKFLNMSIKTVGLTLFLWLNLSHSNNPTIWS